MALVVKISLSPLSALLGLSRNGHHCVTSMLHTDCLSAATTPNVVPTSQTLQNGCSHACYRRLPPFLPSSLTHMPIPLPTKPTSGYKQAISDTTRAQTIQLSFGPLVSFPSLFIVLINSLIVFLVYLVSKLQVLRDYPHLRTAA
jgi:hypothetical protein